MLEVNFICEMAEIWEIAESKSQNASLIFPVLKIIQMTFSSKNEDASLGYKFLPNLFIPLGTAAMEKVRLFSDIIYLTCQSVLLQVVSRLFCVAFTL
jgi:hypothetical protein